MWQPPLNIMKHFTAYNIQFPECRRCTVCLLRTCPSHYSICKQQHVIPAVQHLHAVFSCFRISFVMIPLIGNTIVRVLLYSVDSNPCIFLISYIFVMIALIGNNVVRVLLYSVDRNPPVPFNRSLSVHELLCIYLEDCGLWVSSCWKSTTLFLLLMHLYSSTSDAEPGKAYRWTGAPVPCVCWYMYLQTSSQANIDHTPCQWVFGMTFTGTAFLETGAWNLVW